MTPKEQLAIIAAFLEGKRINYRIKSFSEWHPLSNEKHEFNFAERDYLLVREPRRFVIYKSRNQAGLRVMEYDRFDFDDNRLEAVAIVMEDLNATPAQIASARAEQDLRD